MKKVPIIRVQPDDATIDMLREMGAQMTETVPFRTKKEAEKYAEKMMMKGRRARVYEDKYTSMEDFRWNVEIEIE
jgi:hypothetical protein